MEKVVIVGGPELGMQKDYLKSLRDRAVKAWGPQTEFERHYAESTTVSSLVDSLLNGSLFSSGRLVFYFQADQIKLKADIQTLLGYIKAPAENSLLVLVSDGFGVDKAIENAVPKENRKIFWEMKGYELERVARDSLACQNIDAGKDAIEAILELVENNSDAIRNECRRLAMFWPKGSSIGRIDVEELLSHNRSEDAFTLFEKMATGSFEQALESLAAILTNREEGSAIGILGGLSFSFKRLRSIYEGMKNGMSYEEAARAQRINSPKLLKIYNTARSRWSSKKTEELLVLITETDSQIRQMGQSQEKTLLEMFLFACI